MGTISGDEDAEMVQCTIPVTKLTTGGRKGWRLHSVHELASLVDPLKDGAILLPD